LNLGEDIIDVELDNVTRDASLYSGSIRSISTDLEVVNKPESAIELDHRVAGPNAVPDRLGIIDVVDTRLDDMASSRVETVNDYVATEDMRQRWDSLYGGRATCEHKQGERQCCAYEYDEKSARFRQDANSFDT